MKERPIRCTTQEVRAILEGRKVKMRLPIKHRAFGLVENLQCAIVRFISPGEIIGWSNPKISIEFTRSVYKPGDGIKCPLGVPGCRLWVRETWAEICGSEDGVCYGEECLEHRFKYKADKPGAKWAGDWPDDFKGHEVPDGAKWKPSIHMSRAASRITLEITDIRVERLQDISENDAIDEGVFYHDRLDGYVTDDKGRNFHASDPRRSYEGLWRSINGPESWEQNPWVWVIEFKRV